MSDATKPFAFSQFVPGFDFLKNLADAAASTTGKDAANAGAMNGIPGIPGMPGLSSWVAPTISVEEVDKRIQELKTVQYWLEQNGHALKATIQALEVQKMTLSTLRGMNVRMEDLAGAFTRHAAAASSAATTGMSSAASAASSPSAPAPEPAPAPEAASDSPGTEAASDAAGGVVDPMQWWNSLTDQFQQIATSAMHEASQIKMPVMPVMPVMPTAPSTSRATKASAPRSAGTASVNSRKKSVPKWGGKPASAGKATPARKRSRGA